MKDLAKDPGNASALSSMGIVGLLLVAVAAAGALIMFIRL